MNAAEYQTWLSLPSAFSFNQTKLFKFPEQLGCFVVCATQCPLDILDCEDDEHPVLLVQPAVFHRQAHAVQQDTIQGFGIRGQALEPLLLKKSLWNAVEGEKLSSLSVEVVKGHAVGSWIKNSDNTSASLRKPPCQYFWGK